ncbi:kinase-like domain-containing protein [Aspergillus pseudoustus]|uniref:Kinase-like domain-containing protein n=1 Tax=Aspergillus pseudoustus TaxID=1810923 RepID=A0ABR4IB17_9EURO
MRQQQPPDQIQHFGGPPETSPPPPLPPDHASSSSSLRADDNNLITGLQQLQEGLKNLRIRSSVESSHMFISEPALQRLVGDTVHDLLRDLLGDVEVEAASVDRYAQIISQEAFKLVAVFVDVKKEDRIIGLLDEGLRDSDLPFAKVSRFDESTLALTTKHGVPINSLKSWDSKSLENLQIKQYRVLSPVFRRHEHYELGEHEILPFVHHDTESDSWPKVAGGFGEVYPVRIHRDHHDFGQGDLPVAVKRMFRAGSFKHEQKAYLDLGPSAHSYIIDLLFTYQYRKKFHLVFRWATGTLKDYWEINANPVINPPFFTWNIQQMTGLASGLGYIHEFKDPKTGAPRFGRHGDIKAQNILRFPFPCSPGFLKIADLGLARVHSEDSRYNSDPKNVRCSPTYSPADMKRGRPVSRKFDIWSLGCMYLDWITYLLLGYKAIKEFSDLRLDGSTSEFAEVREDTFYTANGEIVNPHVFVWVNKLKRQRHCSQMLHDILDLIMKKMILIPPEMRSSSQDVTRALEQILARAQQDENYLVGPNPITGWTHAPRGSCCAAEFRRTQAPSTRETWQTPKSRTWKV